VIFENFFEILRKASRGPSEADLDHYGCGQTRSDSRVLVTKFRQNQLTLKGRSAGQRHTDTRQTNSAENNGPSGFAIGPTDRPTDHDTRGVTIGRIYVRSTAMRPDNDNDN